MALQSSGAISHGNIQTEFGGSAPISLSEYYRGGTYVMSNTTTTNVPTSGTISNSNFYGATRIFQFTISTNQTNSNLRTLAVTAGWDQSAPVYATVASGVYLSSTATGTPALTVSGSFPGGATLVNNGSIVGMGGAGGRGAYYSGSSGVAPVAGSSGGISLLVSTSITINNVGTIAGGGGGGGGGQSLITANKSGYVDGYWSGGGGGGGRSSASTNSAGGAAGGNDFGQRSRVSAAGAAGTVSAPGGGGIGGAAPNASYSGGSGGTGGQWGSAGTRGQGYFFGNGTEQLGRGTAAGGAAGTAVSGNSWITWSGTGTRLGPIV